MSTMNRMANSSNRYQGDYPRVLTVCSAGLLRSPTIAWLMGQEPYNCNTRAAGVSHDYGLILVDDVLIEWAELIVAAEDWHAEAVVKRFDMGNKLTIPLNVPDVFPYRDPKLIEAIIEKLAHHGLTDEVTIRRRIDGDD